MRTGFLLAILAATAWGQPTLRVTTGEACTEGLARAVVEWTAPQSPVQVRVGGLEGTPLTGLEEATGRAETGDWVTDGMVFVLVYQERVIAQAAAHLACLGGNALSEAQARLGWLPLQVGNRWVYRADDRLSTGNYTVWDVTGTREFNGRTYYELRGIGSLRSDEQGRVWRWAEGAESLYLDPTTRRNAASVLPVDSVVNEIETDFGRFPGQANYQFMAGLRGETGSFVRGLGLVSRRGTLLTGSSGGFTDGLQLVEARIAGRLVYRRSEPGLRFSVESTRLDVTGRTAPNCAVPCYFTACYLAPGADPPGTYKPCMRVSFDAEQLGEEAAEVTLEQNGTVLTRTQRQGSGAVRLNLYGEQNRPVPPGRYSVAVKVGDTRAAIPITIE
jgi:hypothetical protein